MMQSMLRGELPKAKNDHHVEASKDEVESVALMWFDANGIICQAKGAMEDGEDLILEVWDTKE